MGCIFFFRGQLPPFRSQRKERTRCITSFSGSRHLAPGTQTEGVTGAARQHSTAQQRGWCTWPAQSTPWPSVSRRRESNLYTAVLWRTDTSTRTAVLSSARAEVPPPPTLQPPLLLHLCRRPSTGTLHSEGQLLTVNMDDDLEPHFMSCKRGRYEDYCPQLAPHKHSQQARTRGQVGGLHGPSGFLPGALPSLAWMVGGGVV